MRWAGLSGGERLVGAVSSSSGCDPRERRVTRGNMLTDSNVEEFEIKEDEPWYDHQDLQQGETEWANT